MTILQSGDTVSIGQAELRVQWQVTEPVAEAPVLVRSYREDQTPSGVRKWSPTSDSTWPMVNVMEQVCQSASPMLLVNARAGGNRVPPWMLEQDDYYAQAPDKVRREHSLQIVTDRPLTDVWKIYSPLDSADAAIWALYDGPTSQVLADAKLYLAWFARPSILELNLQHGSDMFLEGLFKPFVGFCFRPPHNQDWVLYGRPGLNRTHFGFQEPA